MDKKKKLEKFTVETIPDDVKVTIEVSGIFYARLAELLQDYIIRTVAHPREKAYQIDQAKYMESLSILHEIGELQNKNMTEKDFYEALTPDQINIETLLILLATIEKQCKADKKTVIQEVDPAQLIKDGMIKDL